LQVDESFGKYASLAELFEDTCNKHKNHPSFSGLGGTLAFKDLELLSRQFASFIQTSTKLSKGDRIVIQLPNILQFPVAFFGSIRAGLVVVTANPACSVQELEHQLKDSGAKAIILLANNVSKFQQLVLHAGLPTVIVTENGDLLSRFKRMLVNNTEKYLKRAVPAYSLPGSHKFLKVLAVGAKRALRKVKLKADSVAALQYTGGTTTGASKGVILSHGNLLSNVTQIKMSLSSDIEGGQETVINPLPFYHIYPLMMSCGVFLEMGCHTVLISDSNDIDRVTLEISKWRFSIILGIDSLLSKLSSHEAFRQLDFSTIKLATAGGSALQADTAKRWRKLTGNEITEGYGLSETSAVVSINPASGNQMGTVGIPLAFTEVKVVDEDGATLPHGEVGELCVRGPQVMQGYWQRAEETSQVLTADRWLKTGDVAMIQNDGYLRIIDRKHDMIKVAGFNVYPKEIEEVICSHPQILECAAVGVPEGDGKHAIKIFVVRSDEDLTREHLREYCRERLTAYKVPKYIEFLSSLPKSNIGKLLRRELSKVASKSSVRAA